MILTFRCELETKLDPSTVMNRIREKASNDIPWFKSRVPPFWGTTTTDRFRISDRDKDPGVVVMGRVEGRNGTTHIAITARSGVVPLIATCIIGAGFTWGAWHELHPIYPILSYLSLVAIPVLLLMLHLRGISEDWEELQHTLDMLNCMINAEIVSRSHDDWGRRSM